MVQLVTPPVLIIAAGLSLLALMHTRSKAIRHLRYFLEEWLTPLKNCLHAPNWDNHRI